MNKLLKLEELIQFLFGVFLFSQTSYSWWVFPALILLPDIGMLGYLINSKTGAFLYNLFHLKSVALIILMLGLYNNNEILKLIGIIMFSHAAMDRIFGYGLKYPDSFKNTHLGKIGKK